MTDLCISLSPAMLNWVEAQVAGGRYGSPSEYVCELIRRDQERRETEQLEHLLLQGVESLDDGRGIEVTPEYWEKKRQELLARAEARANAKAQEGT